MTKDAYGWVECGAVDFTLWRPPVVAGNFVVGTPRRATIWVDWDLCAVYAHFVSDKGERWYKTDQTIDRICSDAGDVNWPAAEMPL
jgi:hypothetical protein